MGLGGRSCWHSVGHKASVLHVAATLAIIFWTSLPTFPAEMPLLLCYHWSHQAPPLPSQVCLPICEMTAGPLRPCLCLRLVYIEQPRWAGLYLLLFTDTLTKSCPRHPKLELSSCLGTKVPAWEAWVSGCPAVAPSPKAGGPSAGSQGVGELWADALP